jgi:alkylation response protein AidB-like acyl-CoA dehydrogenase
MSYVGNTRIAFSEEQAMLLDVARAFCREHSPIPAVRAQLDSDSGYEPQVWNAMVDLGWAGIALPEGLGGSGLGVATVVPVVEAMGRALLGTPLISSTLAAQLLWRASGEAHAEVLSAIAAGTPATVALLDEGDWGAAHTGCTLDAEGTLRGSKSLVPDAGVAAWFVLSCASEGAPALALVRREQLREGAVRPHSLLDETHRAARVDFSGVQPAALVVGPAVAAALRDFLLLGALLSAAEAAGAAASCLDTTVDYLSTRKQFGKLIGSYQALKHPAVDILTAVDATRSLVYHAATLLEDGPLSRDAEIACRMAKAQATDTLCHAGDRAVQFHGGMGFTYECNAQLYLQPRLRAWQARILAVLLSVAHGGLDEWHQAYVPGRYPSLNDVAADSLGAILGVALLALLMNRASSR